MKLFGYWRSSATYRVRIAMALKNLDYDYEAVNLLKGEQRSEAYLQKNPTGLVPSLETDDGNIIMQSLAIMEYLEEAYPENPILPEDSTLAGHARAIAMSIASEAQPLMNLRIQHYLKTKGDFDDAAISAWLNKWPAYAMGAVEKIVTTTSGQFCVGDTPSIADCCLVPQFFAAGRFGIDLSQFPTLTKINEHCQALPAFEKAHPKNQPDAPDD